MNVKSSMSRLHLSKKRLADCSKNETRDQVEQAAEVRRAGRIIA
jgi:hypothetical protein